MTRSDRRARGERHPRAALPDEDVELMRKLHEDHRIGYGTIAKKFEVPKSTVRSVCTYRTR